MKAYLGVDWSATEIVCAVAGEEGRPKRIRGRTRPTLESVRALLERVRTMAGGDGADEVIAMIEAGSPIWIWLLFTAGAVVHVVDSKQARRFAESQGSSGAKDDARDAESLTDMCRSPSHRRSAWTPDSPEIQQLEVLAELHEQITRDLGRAKQRLREVLRRTMPTVEKALSKELRTRWVEVFLRKVPTPWHARHLTRAALDRMLVRVRSNVRDRIWEALQETQAPWLHAAVARTTAMQVQFALGQLALLGKQLDQVEKQMDQVTKDMVPRQVAESMGGIALKLSATLIQYAFRDGVPADRDQASVRMGASPVFTGSARRKDGKPKGTVHMRRAAPSRARRATYLIGRLASQHLDWGRAMYADAMERGQKPATAYRRIARCVLRIQTAMVRTQQPYDNARYVAALKAKGIRWAEGLQQAA